MNTVSRNTVAVNMLARNDEARFRISFERAAVGIAHVAPSGAFLEVNDRLCELTGYSRDELLRLSIADLESVRGAAAADVARLALLAGTIDRHCIEKRYRRKDGSAYWVGLNVTVVRDELGTPMYLIGMVEDISLRKQAEFRLQRLNRLYSVLRRIGAAIVGTTDRQQLYAAACRIAVEVGGLRMVMIAAVDANSERVVPVASFGAGLEYLQGLEISAHGERSQGTVGTALRTGQHDVCNDIGTDPRMQPWRESALQSGFRAIASFPLKVSGVTIGAYTLFAAEIDYFQHDEVDLMVSIADELAFAIEALEKSNQREITEAALRTSESSLREAQRIAQLGNWEWDVQRDQLRWSEQIYRLFERAPGSFADVLPSQALFDAVHAEDVAGVKAEFQHCIDSGGGCDIEYRVVLSGHEITVHTRGQAFFDAAGRVARLAGTAQDITERRRSEERLRQSEALLRIAGQTARIGGWTFDLASQRLTLSDEVCAMRELPSGTVLSIEAALNMYAPECCEVVARAFASCRQHATPYDLEAEILTASGKRVWIRTMGHAVRGATGAIVRLQGAMQDISERKRTEAQALRLSDRLTTTLESITDAFFTLDAEWRFTYVNRETERMLQRTRTELRDACVWDLFPEIVRSNADTQLRRAVADGCTVEFEHFYAPLNLWAGVRAYPSEGGLAIYFRDIGERKQAEQEALRAERVRAAILLVQEEIGGAELSLQQVMTLIAERTHTLTGAGGCAIDLVQGDELVITAAAGSLVPAIGTHLPGGDSLSGRAVHSGQTLSCVDSETDPRVDRATTRKFGVRSMIVVPLRDGEQVIGVLKVTSDRPRAFTERDVSTLQILAQSLGAALQRHRADAALRASEMQYRLLFNSNPHPMWVYDIATLRFLAVNEAATRHYGYSEAEFLAMTIRDIRLPAQIPKLEQSLSRLDEGKRHLGAWQHRRKDASIVDVEISSDRIIFNDSVARLVLAHDVTERLRAERELVRVSRAQRLLSLCMEAQMRAEEESVLLTEICQIAVDIGGYRMAWVGYAQHDAARTILPVAQAGDEAGYLPDVVLTWSEDDPSGMEPAGRTIRNGRPTVSADITLESAHFHWHARALECGYRGVICLPLRDAEHTFGLLGLYTQDVQPSSDEEIQLLQELADNLAFGIGNLRAQHERKQLQKAVMKVAAGVSASTGTAFFEQLTRSMTEAVGADAGYVARLDASGDGSAHSIMAVAAGEVVSNFSYQIEGTPCLNLLDAGQCTVPEHVADRYPGDTILRDMGVEAYVGRRLDNSHGKPIGLLYVLFHKALQRTDFVTSTLQIFAARAAAELERLDSDARIREQASLLDQAQDAIVVHDLPEHRILYWNQGAERLYGWTAEQALGRVLSELLQIDPEQSRVPMQHVVEHGEWSGEFNERRMDGSALLVEVRCTLSRNANQQPRSVLSIMSDITERRHAEEKLQQALADLSNRNRELQDFAFVASHDLQEPLRKIRAFSDRLISRPSSGLDESARDYLRRSAQAAERMQTLIDDLLEYSRIDSRGKAFAPVELGALLATVIEDLNERVEATSASIEVGPMPTLDGDYTQLRQLFQNLLANALKFHHGERTPLIRIHAEAVRTDQSRPAFRISVEDNGIGFDSKYAERIFAPFQRLHSREKYEGTGIGLAIVRRIVERHRGRIDVSAIIDQGATFSVVLPQRQRLADRDREAP